MNETDYQYYHIRYDMYNKIMDSTILDFRTNVWRNISGDIGGGLPINFINLNNIR
jgi:hypothetical protein